MRDVARDPRGTAAVEFGLVAVPALLTICAIVEIGLYFFMAAALDHATYETGRNLMTGATQTGGFTAAQVQSQVCGYLPSMFTCSNVFVNISSNTAPAYITSLSSPYQSTYYNYVNSTKSGLTQIPFSSTQDTFTTSTSIGNCFLVVVQVAYPTPFLFSFLTSSTAPTYGGQKVGILTSQTTFVTEPFPASANVATTGC